MSTPIPKKDRALVAQVAAYAAAGIAGLDFMHTGWNLKHDAIASEAVRIARAILREVDAQSDTPEPEKK